MGKLDARGGISIVLMIIYIPILLVSAVLVKRHGFKRQAGWIFLLILSLVRIVGSIAHLVAELSNNPSSGLIETFSILDNIGLSPLMGCTLGFLNTVGAGAFEDNKRLSTALRLMGILATVAMILTVVGGIDVGEANDQSDLNSATKYRHIGGVLYVILYLLVALAHGFFWSQKEYIMLHRRTLLVGISAVLPFLFIRVLYSILSDFAPAAIEGVTPHHNGLSKFSSTTGSWGIYLLMSVICELLVVFVYLYIGISVPVTKEYDAHAMGAVPQADNQTYQPNYNPGYAPQAGYEPNYKPYNN
ncbi:hypothetical protein EUX98_g287 [Antrodiella citrinella]|uniref:DUF7702 domain-containing protein n=1 Tax=Antrodiella citrinella TaxID=2447956 RepID=A0A4S4N678_9APHY|nr:hypothetical protein EUX98_g287 [Antrodiella citrinella]